MKILVLGSRIPYPQRDGGAIATFGMLKELSNLRLEITYFSFNTKKHFVDETTIKKQFHFCRVITSELDANPNWKGAFLSLLKNENYNLARFKDSSANNKLAKLLQEESFDIVHFEGLFTTPFLSVVKQYASSTVCLLRQHNVEHHIWQKLAETENNFFKKWYLRYLTSSLKKEEDKILKEFNHILSITPSDLGYFIAVNPAANCMNYPAGMELPEIKPESQIQESYSICHIGSMEWMPNREAVIWFIRNVLPAIRREFAETSFHIAGKGLKEGDPDFSGIGVVNHGEVGDAKAFLSLHRIVAIPLLAGSGLRMKTIEAMAMGKPVISTSNGAQGIEYTNKYNIVIADTVEAWVQAVREIFRNPDFANTLGKNGRALVEASYNNRKNTELLVKFYHTCLQSTKK